MDWLVKEDPPSYKDGVQTRWEPLHSVSTVTEYGPGILLGWSEFMLRVVSSCSTAQRRSSRRSICPCLYYIVSLRPRFSFLWNLQLRFPIGSGVNLRPAARACLLARKTGRLAVPTRPGAITANLPQTFSIQCYVLGLKYPYASRILQPSHCAASLVYLYLERDFHGHTARGVTEARCRLAWIVSLPPWFPAIANCQII